VYPFLKKYIQKCVGFTHFFLVMKKLLVEMIGMVLPFVLCVRVNVVVVWQLCTSHFLCKWQYVQTCERVLLDGDGSVSV